MSNSNTFHIGNFKYYSGPNPYLNTGALVCDFRVISETKSLAVTEYQKEIGQIFPNLLKLKLTGYADLFAQTLSLMSPLQMDLHLNRISIKNRDENIYTIALESLHYTTSRELVETLWQWLEAITLRQNFDFEKHLTHLQQLFRNSVYGDPTVYALLRTAFELNIPSFFIWEEGLMQYGYGKYQIRGLSTIFDRDGLLDSDLTTQKDDCKDLLSNLGFPVPKGTIVYYLEEALNFVTEIGYPVAIKPVAGHEGIGVTAQIQDEKTLIVAFQKAQVTVKGDNPPIIIEQSLSGFDFRLLSIGKKFVAALQRLPPYIIGDGLASIAELIERENQTEARQDTPTSPLTKILVDETLKNCLEEQNLSLESVIESGKIVYLRKVANISAGGVSIDVTDLIHPDNKQLVEDIAQYLNITCLGIDVITDDIAKSWQKGNFGIIEINASPGVFMHLKPAQGKSIDVPRQIFQVFFPCSQPCRIPIITFNRLNVEEIRQIINHILAIHSHYLIGAICQSGIWLNEREKIKQNPYNQNIQSFLRHPHLDLLIAEYPEDIFQTEGLFYQESDLIILIEPTDIELILLKSLAKNGCSLIQYGDSLTKTSTTSKETFRINNKTEYLNICCQAIAKLLNVYQ